MGLTVFKSNLWEAAPKIKTKVSPEAASPDRTVKKLSAFTHIWTADADRPQTTDHWPQTRRDFSTQSLKHPQSLFTPLIHWGYSQCVVSCTLALLRRVPTRRCPLTLHSIALPPQFSGGVSQVKSPPFLSLSRWRQSQNPWNSWRPLNQFCCCCCCVRIRTALSQTREKGGFVDVVIRGIVTKKNNNLRFVSLSTDVFTPILFFWQSIALRDIVHL